MRDFNIHRHLMAHKSLAWQLVSNICKQLTFIDVNLNTLQSKVAVRVFVCSVPVPVCRNIDHIKFAHFPAVKAPFFPFVFINVLGFFFLIQIKGLWLKGVLTCSDCKSPLSKL